MSAVFEVASQPPPGGSKDFSLDRWDEWRDRVVPPQYRSALGSDPAGRIEFLVGAALYGLRFDPDADPLTPGVLKPQQLLVSDLLDVLHDDYAFEIPRRASKTTSILIKLLGRCAMRPEYQVAFAAQSGIAGSRRFGEWQRKLNRVNPETDSTPPWLRGKKRPASKRHLRAVALFGEDLLGEQEAEEETYGYGREPSELLPEQYRHAVQFRILAGEVGKGIYWHNGSQLLIFKPDESAVRGEAADVFWLDEAQDVDPDDAAELMSGLKPLMDTKPGAALVVSGTAGPARVGPLWETLELLRAGDPDVGGCDYTAGQYEVDAEPIDWALIEDEASALDLVQRVHPGIGTLTTLEVMRKRYRDPKIPHPQWAREYLSIWPRVAGARAVPTTWWEATSLDWTPDQIRAARPKRVAFASDIKPGGETAAICAAWRDEDGVAWIDLVAHQLGTGWLPEQYAYLSRTYTGSDVSFDDIGEGRATATEALNRRPRPRLRVQTYRDHATGCVQILRDLERGTLRHYGSQAGLNEAVRVAARRELRGESRGVWLWGVGPEGGDIAPLVAATRALRAWDMHYAGTQRKRRVVTAS